MQLIMLQYIFVYFFAFCLQFKIIYFYFILTEAIPLCS